VSSPSDGFECRWQASGHLLAAYLSGQLLALVSLILLEIPLWLSLVGIVLCLAHAAWVLPRYILLNHPQAVTGLRRDSAGWQLWRAAEGWQPVQLQRDSLALPGLVVLRFRWAGRRWVYGLCIPFDALEPVQHRRLRLRLKFSRRRWAAPE
jgi:toxin CptA